MNLDQLVTQLRDLDSSLKSHVTQSANIGLTLRNWLVGAYIVEFEQNGEDRAEYGEGLIPELSSKLNIKGLSARNLEVSRLLYQSYPSIPQTLSAEFNFLTAQIPQTASAESHNTLFSSNLKKPQTPSGKSKTPHTNSA